jgi:hypothetical protein
MLPTSIQVWRKHTGLPRAMALRLIRDRPGDPAFCDTIVSSKLSPLANLTPASGRRTQTISPYASAALVSRCLASTAPCPSFATMANAPLMGQDGGILTSDFPISPAKCFFGEDWTGGIALKLFDNLTCSSSRSVSHRGYPRLRSAPLRAPARAADAQGGSAEALNCPIGQTRARNNEKLASIA